MRFQHTLLLVALAILVCTLLLSSLLSLASFEKLYSSSLVATYEASGKNMQRRIQAAIRLGRPLELYSAMDELIAEVMEAEPNLLRIDVLTPQQTLLYSSSDQLRGTPSPLQGSLPDLHTLEDRPVITQLIGESYFTLLPLRDRNQQLVGMLHLEFSRAEVYQRLREMAWRNLQSLIPIMLAAAVLLVLLIHQILLRPINRDVAALAKVEEGQAVPTTSASELEALGQALVATELPPEESPEQLEQDLAAIGEALEAWARRPGTLPEGLAALRAEYQRLRVQLADTRPSSAAPTPTRPAEASDVAT